MTSSVRVHRIMRPIVTLALERPAPRAIPLLVRVTKRGIDLAFALVGLCVALWLFPLIALAIRIDSRGPVFYRQRRAGALRGRDVHGRCAFVEFEMLKFRTMRPDAERLTGAVLAQEMDPRVTRVGRLLRKTRLDELPQIWNVLKGDMSLVGPRPERPELFEDLALAIPFFEQRMRDCKPGITGLSQVSLGYTGRAVSGSDIAAFEDLIANPFKLEHAKGAPADDMRMKLLFDLAYVIALETFWTFLVVELWTIAKTPVVMLRGLGR
ncbi:MAG TPA: sugar transferase [Polyangiaceae bacterium]|nr:sugar transferase [Polyangiaceae bacterium]